MSYDQNKDKILKYEEFDCCEGRFLQMSICSYAGGPPKLQFLRRYKKRDDTYGYSTSIGRLTLQEVIWLNEVMRDFVNKMEETIANRK